MSIKKEINSLLKSPKKDKHHELKEKITNNNLFSLPGDFITCTQQSSFQKIKKT